MRTLLVFTSLLAACSTVQPHETSSDPQSELPAGDMREIRGIFARWENAWQAHDMQSWAQLFHEDGTYVTWMGRVWVGRAAIEQGMAEAHRSVFKNSVQLSRPDEIRLVAPDVVVARSLTTLTGDTREPRATIYGRKLVVITRRDGEWKILYGQAVRLPPAMADTIP